MSAAARRRADPHINQRRAAEPWASVWVSASAGTGKTRVLTDRLLRLMLDGTDPGRLLCLTFTRAAAAEMANRLNTELARWATLPQGALAETLQRLAGAMPDEAAMTRARQLFARVLDTPGGIKIATIHAFCQSLLRRFPLEAGVAPEFAVIDERGAREALAEAAQTVVLATREDGNSSLATALATVARHAGEERFGELMAELVREHGRLDRALADGSEALRARLRAALGIPPNIDEAALTAEFCAGGDIAALRAAAAALAQGSKTDRERSAILAQWCAEPESRRERLDDYLATFLTDKGQIRKTLITKPAAAAAGCDAAAFLASEAERAQALLAVRAAATLAEASSALACLGGALLAAYDERKRREGALVYDDLIERSLALLRRPGIAPWVLFKLDGGIDHILIDEAQDTNPEQWQIVTALAEEFFAGAGARDRPRTVFAVGDPKQSIFSFQRADPQAFLEMRRHFEKRIAAANQSWQTVPLDISFRSTEPVLKAVDTIFRHDPARDGVALDGSPVRHQPSRGGQAGLVELWPPVAPDQEEPAGLPLARQRVAAPQARLSEAIAATIGNWIDHGERLESRDRRLRPGDVMVLVRRRNEFVGALLAALKGRGIAVAGADRLVLTAQLAVQDLIALGRFLLLPEDDLTLATVLKGPLFGIDEETLFALAYDRGNERLWRRLRARAGGSPALREAADRLSALLARADFVPPYELYAELLGAEGGRRAILERLGPEAADPVEEFLALALAYERQHVPSLQGFLRWLIAGDTEVKRDLAARERDEVRILTVHGAKGLEAPVVFLPDTMQVPNLQTSLLWTETEELPLWRPAGAPTVPLYDTEKDARRRRMMQEYRRLLYVALTRAEDRLYICGYETRQAASEGCWYALCQAGLADCADLFDFDNEGLIGRDGWRGTGLRLHAAQISAPKRDRRDEMATIRGPLPDWAKTPPPREPDPPRPLLPSQPGGPEPPASSPLAMGGRDRFRRGLLVHRLLQSLPELPPASREGAAQRFLALPTHDLPAEEQTEICRETLAVLAHPDFAPLFGPQSVAEVPLVGLIGGYALSGQIDRLVVDGKRVLIVDYKTLRSPPDSEDHVPPVYLRQLAIYRQALVRIYPDHEICCALLWTEGPRLMPISPNRLEACAP